MRRSEVRSRLGESISARARALGVARWCIVAIAALGLGCGSTAADDSTFLPSDAGDAGGDPDGVSARDALVTDAGVADAATGASLGDATTIDARPGDSAAADDAVVLDASQDDAGSDNVLPIGCAPDGGHGGDRWQDLYACYFGPLGVANCSLNSACHGTGAGAATIWTCGATSAQCYAGMRASLLPDAGVTDPTTTLLYFSLRKADGSGGSMPELPDDVTFDTQDLSRIDAWITKGAPND